MTARQQNEYTEPNIFVILGFVIVFVILFIWAFKVVVLRECVLLCS
jgi:hypothetical protein